MRLGSKGLYEKERALQRRRSSSKPPPPPPDRKREPPPPPPPRPSVALATLLPTSFVPWAARSGCFVCLLPYVGRSGGGGGGAGGDGKPISTSRSRVVAHSLRGGRAARREGQPPSPFLSFLLSSPPKSERKRNQPAHGRRRWRRSRVTSSSALLQTHITPPSLQPRFSGSSDCIIHPPLSSDCPAKNPSLTPSQDEEEEEDEAEVQLLLGSEEYGVGKAGNTSDKASRTRQRGAKRASSSRGSPHGNSPWLGGAGLSLFRLSRTPHLRRFLLPHRHAKKAVATRRPPKDPKDFRTSPFPPPPQKPTKEEANQKNFQEPSTVAGAVPRAAVSPLTNPNP